MMIVTYFVPYGLQYYIFQLALQLNLNSFRYLTCQQKKITDSPNELSHAYDNKFYVLEWFCKQMFELVWPSRPLHQAALVDKVGKMLPAEVTELITQAHICLQKTLKTSKMFVKC